MQINHSEDLILQSQIIYFISRTKIQVYLGNTYNSTQTPIIFILAEKVILFKFDFSIPQQLIEAVNIYIITAQLSWIYAY